MFSATFCQILRRGWNHVYWLLPFHWTISATLRGSICCLSDSSFSIDAYPGFTHFLFTDRRRNNIESSRLPVMSLNSIGVEYDFRQYLAPALSWQLPANKVLPRHGLLILLGVSGLGCKPTRGSITLIYY